jgi:hypothetical protein
LHSKSAMPIFMKVVCLAKLHIFPLGDFWSVKWIFGERAEVLEWHKGVKGKLGFLARDLTMGWLRVLKGS